MEKLNAFEKQEETLYCHLQVVYLYEVCNLPFKEIARITGYAESTVRSYVKKFASCLALAKAYFDNKAKIEPILTLYRRFRDGRSVPMEFMPGYGEDLKNEQTVYFFKFYNGDIFLFDKIGTTTKSAVTRLRDEIGDYIKNYPITRVEIHRIRSCYGLPAEGYESELRAKFIADYPNSFMKNDRFFNVDIPASVFDTVCDEYFNRLR